MRGSQRDGSGSGGWSSRRRPHVRLGAVLALAIAAGVIAWLVTKGGSNSQPAAPTSTLSNGTNKVVRTNPLALQTLAAALKRPIYWAGPAPGDTYELTQTSDGRIYIRYLPQGTKLGTGEPLLTIGTYPVQNAFAVTERVAKASSSVRIPIAGNGVAFHARGSATNIYLAYRGSDYQVEVYDPSAARARQLVVSGQVAPVLTSTAPAAVSLGRLKAVARSLGHPVYWTGTEPGVTYELTQTADGRFYVRYLSPGERAGTTKPFLTIGTYPRPNAFAVTRGLASGKAAVPIAVGGGGVAFYSRGQPTNIYVAFPHVDYQIEIYDPSAATAKRLVTSGRLIPIR